MFTFLTTTHTHTTTRVRPAFNTFQALFSFKYIIQAGVPGVASGIKKIFFEEKISNYYPPGSYGFSKQISAYSIQCSRLSILQLPHIYHTNLEKTVGTAISRGALPVHNERGKSGGHEPPLFSLPYHILAFFLFRQP